MNAVDIILIVLIAAALAAAVFIMVRRKKKGSGCCGGSDCSCCDKCGSARASGWRRQGKEENPLSRGESGFPPSP